MVGVPGVIVPDAVTDVVQALRQVQGDGAGPRDQRRDERVWIIGLFPRPAIDIRRGQRRARSLESRAHQRGGSAAVEDETGQAFAAM